MRRVCYAEKSKGARRNAGAGSAAVRQHAKDVLARVKRDGIE